MEDILSINDVLWRTLHGYVGLRGLEENYYDNEFLADLKSVCSDVSNIKVIAKPSGLTFLKKDAIPDNELQDIKTKYRKIEDYLTKKIEGKANEKGLEETIKIADSLMKYFKSILQIQ